MGSGVGLLALALHSADMSVSSRAIAGILFFLLTAPISAHLVARVAYISGIKPWKGTVIDEYGENIEKGKRVKLGRASYFLTQK